MSWNTPVFVPGRELPALQKRPVPYGTLCLIEVKWRPTLEEAVCAISQHQRERLTRAAAAYLQRHPQHAASDLRYDALLMAPGVWPRHLRDAWRD